MFDSGWVCSPQQRCQPGIPLPLGETIDWTLRLKDDHGQTSSEARARFIVGSIDWTAGWISPDWEDASRPGYFRKCFTLDETPVSANLYICGLGYFTARVNSRPLQPNHLDPAHADYTKTCMYVLFPGIDGLTAGENTLDVTVAAGWRSNDGRYLGKQDKPRFFGPLALSAMLVMEFADGSKRSILTDDTWQCGTGPIVFSHLFDGETYDARLESVACRPVKTIDPPGGVMRPMTIPPILEENEIEPAAVSQTGGGWLLDFGKNIAGVPRLRFNFTPAPGQTITLRCCERLREDGTPYFDNLRGARATDTYIASGAEKTSPDAYWQPQFTYHGFRYIELRGADPYSCGVSAVPLHTALRSIGSFRCGSALINAIQDMVVLTERDNMHSILTDCPQRDERMGWTGDIAVFASTACFNFDTARFFDKWLLDVIHDQGRGGGIPFVVPAGKLGIPTFATAGWGDCASLVPWAQYWKSGDRKLIERQYESIKKLLHAEKFWASFFSLGHKRYIWKLPFQFGDWLSPSEDSKEWKRKAPWIATAYFYNTAHIAAELAETLGKEKDAGRFRALMGKIEDAYRGIYTDGSGRLGEEFQTGYICPIYFGMLTESERSTMGARLADLAEKNNYKIATGFLGTPFLLFALSDTGHMETAYRVLLNEECPGWLYAVNHGATTIWERWDALLPDGTVNLSNDQAGGGNASSADFDPEDQSAPSMTSFNHYAYGAVGDWLYRRVAGLEALEPGWKRFRVKPHPGGGLTWAEAHTQTPFGKASSHWEIKDGFFELTVRVPEGTICEATLPDGTTQTLSSGTLTLRCAYGGSEKD